MSMLPIPRCMRDVVSRHWRKLAAVSVVAAGSLWVLDQMNESSYGTSALERMAASVMGIEAGQSTSSTTTTTSTSTSSSSTTTTTSTGSGDPHVLDVMKNHFQTTQETADETLVRWVGLVADQVSDMVPLDATIASLTPADGVPLGSDDKATIWENLVRLSLVQGMLGVYAVVLLKVMFRTQVNVLGRNVYLDMVQSAAAAGPGSASDTLKHKFLARCFFFLKVGIRRLAQALEDAVVDALASSSLTSLHSVNSLMDLVAAVRTALEGPSTAPTASSPAKPTSASRLAQFLVPSPAEVAADPRLRPLPGAGRAAEAAGSASPLSPDDDVGHPLFAAKLELLTSELSEYILSGDMAQILDDCLDLGFAQFRATLQDKASVLQAGDASLGPDETYQLARFVGPLVGAAKAMLDVSPESTNPVGLSLARKLSSVASLERLCALIYSDFDRKALFEVVAPPPSPIKPSSPVQPSS